MPREGPITHRRVWPHGVAVVGILPEEIVQMREPEAGDVVQTLPLQITDPAGHPT